MKIALTNIFLACLLAALPVVAAIEELEDERSCEQVENMLEARNTPAEVVAAMVDAGMALSGATVFSMECADASYRVYIAEAGVGLASDIDQARSVAAAVALAAGDTNPESIAASESFKNYEKTAKQPETYKTDYTPHGGGGASPST